MLLYSEVYSRLSQVTFEAYVEFKIHATYQTDRCHGPEEHNLNHSLLMEEMSLSLSRSIDRLQVLSTLPIA
jgi:hypothetical protein